jgi:hypothetical protein
MNLASLNVTTLTYAAYLTISALVTIWVARTLHRSGRLFLVKTFHGDDSLADSVNDLLVVGFYLINFGYVALALRFGGRPTDLQGAIEILATKIGIVLIILGAMHFANLAIFSRIGRGPARPPIRGAAIRGENPFAPATFPQN